MNYRIFLVLLTMGMGACGDGTGPNGSLTIDVSDFVYPGVSWRLGSGYSRHASATGGNGSYAWTIESGSLPPGLALIQQPDGRVNLEGTLTTLGVFPFTLRVSTKGRGEGSGLTAQEALSITVIHFLEPGELCSDNDPETAIATFQSLALGEAIRAALSVPSLSNITCRLASGLTDLTAQSTSDGNLVGFQNLTGLVTLDLSGNAIYDISPLSGLTNLTALWISATRGIGGPLEQGLSNIQPLLGLTSLTLLDLSIGSITDISALIGLTSLVDLRLEDNPDLTDIQSLLDNAGLAAGDTVNLLSTNVSCTDVAALEAKGVTVASDCP